jgi:hypothetical protein
VSLNVYGENEYSLSYLDFTRFITKLKWINTRLWEIERKESYQYFTSEEICNALKKAKIDCVSMKYYISDISLWKKHVTLTDCSKCFPWENILVTSTRNQK